MESNEQKILELLLKTLPETLLNRLKSGICNTNEEGDVEIHITLNKENA